MTTELVLLSRYLFSLFFSFITPLRYHHFAGFHWTVAYARQMNKWNVRQTPKQWLILLRKAPQPKFFSLATQCLQFKSSESTPQRSPKPSERLVPRSAHPPTQSAAFRWWWSWCCWDSFSFCPRRFCVSILLIVDGSLHGHLEEE